MYQTVSKIQFDMLLIYYNISAGRQIIVDYPVNDIAKSVLKDALNLLGLL